MFISFHKKRPLPRTTIKHSVVYGKGLVHQVLSWSAAPARAKPDVLTMTAVVNYSPLQLRGYYLSFADMSRPVFSQRQTLYCSAGRRPHFNFSWKDWRCKTGKLFWQCPTGS